MKNIFYRFAYLLLSSVLVSIILSSCSGVSNTNLSGTTQVIRDCRTVQHVMGDTCIPHNPQRIVMLREDYWINGLELGVQSIATVSVPGFPFPKYLQDKVNRIQTIGGYGSPNLEKLLSLQPDLIVAESSYSTSLYEQLSQIAPTVVLNMPFPSPPWQEQLEEIAYILDREEEGKQLINDYWKRVEKLKQALGDRRHHLKISIANTSSEYGIWSYGKNHPAGAILKDIELQRPEAQRGDFFYIENISIEKLSTIDGDILFFVSWEREDDQKTLERLKQNPLWAKLEVVQKNRVYLVGGHWHSSDILAIHAILDDMEKYLVNNP